MELRIEIDPEAKAARLSENFSQAMSEMMNRVTDLELTIEQLYNQNLELQKELASMKEGQDVHPESAPSTGGDQQEP